MAKHRSHSIEFKGHVAQEFIAGETLHCQLIIDPSEWRPSTEPY